jgi:hypothetical protein
MARDARDLHDDAQPMWDTARFCGDLAALCERWIPQRRPTRRLPPRIAQVTKSIKHMG